MLFQQKELNIHILDQDEELLFVIKAHTFNIIILNLIVNHHKLINQISLMDKTYLKIEQLYLELYIMDQILLSFVYHHWIYFNMTINMNLTYD